MKVEIYTDGSSLKNPGPGGWAVVFTDKKLGIRKGSQQVTTNNRMELQAVVVAVRDSVSMAKEKVSLITRMEKLEEATIYSDSAYVVNALTKGWLDKWSKNGWKNSSGDVVKNVDLWEKMAFYLDKAKEMKVKLNFVKVKGHSGNEWNELADRIAKDAAKDAKSNYKID